MKKEKFYKELTFLWYKTNVLKLKSQSVIKCLNLCFIDLEKTSSHP